MQLQLYEPRPKLQLFLVPKKVAVGTAKQPVPFATCDKVTRVALGTAQFFEHVGVVAIGAVAAQRCHTLVELTISQVHHTWL